VSRAARITVVSASVGAALGLGAACGSRTGVGGGDQGPNADGGVTYFDGPVSADTNAPPIFEGGALDVSIDCNQPVECDPANPGFLYECGTAVFQCSALEQCVEACDGGRCTAQCANPCQDSLGQNTSNGCDFYPLELDTATEVAGSCYAVFVINQWKTGQPARIEVDRGGVTLPIEQFARIPYGQGLNVQYAPYDPKVGLAEGQVVILFLSRDPNALNDPTANDPRVLASCPDGVIPAVAGDSALHGSGVGTAFHVSTNVPVVAYQMLPYGGGRARVTGATLLLPTNVWDTNYVVANAYAQATNISGDRAMPTLDIVAQRDGTHVTIDPKVDLVANDDGGPIFPPSEAGTPVTFTLGRGEYLQISQNAELTGSPIVADQPVGVFGGSTLMDIPVQQYQRADGAEQMLPPVRALGHEYVAVRYRSRDPANEEIVPWRLVGAVDGTTLTWDPAPPPGAPTQLAARELVEIDAPGPFVVSSQDAAHPFYFASYMTGGQPYDGIGDPEFVNVVPAAQYLPHYTFFTDPTYPETNLVVVRTRDATSGLMPTVSLDCAGTLGGWQAVGTHGKYEFTRIDLSTGDFVGQNGCDNGVHIIQGAFPSSAGDGGGARTAAFGVTVWGWGNDVTWQPDDETNPLFTRWVSYGYPAGANFAPLNSVVVPAR
jgi:hypothetical protein